MNPLKHMELIFGIVLAVTLVMSPLTERNARASAIGPLGEKAVPVAHPVATAGGPMAVVIVNGKRLSSRDKRRAALGDSHMRIF